MAPRLDVAKGSGMGKSCCQASGTAPTAHDDPRWRAILWVALVANAAMFALEMVAGLAADSRALQADALDFLGDAANYAISLGVAGLALAWRARAALVKAATMLAFGLWVVGYAVYGLAVGSAPQAQTMGLVGALALAVNLAVALLLFRYRGGDANMRSVWICSRNDAIGNLAVLTAAAGVFRTGRAWPDLLVATLVAGLAIRGSAQVFTQARRELAHG